MLQKYFVPLALFVLTLAPSHVTLAQSSDAGPDPEYIRNSVNLLPQNFFGVELFNTPHVSETDFTMRLFIPGDIGGCAQIVEPFLKEDQKERFQDMQGGVEKKLFGDTLRLNILRPEMQISKYDPRYTNYDCEVKNNRAIVDIPLNRDELINQEVKKMNFEIITHESEEDFGTIDIDINDDRFIFKGKSVKGDVWFYQWFFPANTVMLHTPHAKTDADVTDLIKQFGSEHGLEPIQNRFAGYIPPRHLKNTILFIDKKGTFSKQLTSLDQTIEAGEITATRTVFDTSGPKEESYTLSVVARKPGKKAEYE